MDTLLILRFNDALNARDVDAMMALQTDDCVFENTYPPPDGARYVGQSAVRGFWEDFIRSNAESHIGVEEIFALGERVVMRWVYHWRDEQGQTGHIRGVDLYRLRDGCYPALFRIARGLLVLFQFVWQFNWLLFLFPLPLLFFRRGRYVALCLLLVVGQVAYSIYVGGDAWEHKGGSNRYFSIVMPVYFVLFVYAADLVFKALASRLRPDASWTRNLSQLVTTVFVFLAMLQSNALLGEVRDLERWLLLRQPTFVEGNKETVQIALDLAEITRPEATVAVVAAGALPYFVDRPAIDLLGKVDCKIARQPAQASASLFGIKNFRPGHVKYDYDYSIGQLKPDVIAQIFGAVNREPFSIQIL